MRHARGRSVQMSSHVRKGDRITWKAHRGIKAGMRPQRSTSIAYYARCDHGSGHKREGECERDACCVLCKRPSLDRPRAFHRCRGETGVSALKRGVHIWLGDTQMPRHRPTTITAHPAAGHDPCAPHRLLSSAFVRGPAALTMAQEKTSLTKCGFCGPGGSGT